MQLRRPSMLLAIAVAVLIGLIGSVALYATNLPSVGITVTTVGGEVIVQSVSGTAESSDEAIALPARLTAASDNSAIPDKIKISGRTDLVRRLETEIMQRDLAPQDKIMAIANTGSVRLWLQD